jgi:glyoxylase-like metal-dependent hydrolase (beta-lactamase superfamily II)
MAAAARLTEPPRTSPTARIPRPAGLQEQHHRGVVESDRGNIGAGEQESVARRQARPVRDSDGGHPAACGPATWLQRSGTSRGPARAMEVVSVGVGRWTEVADDVFRRRYEPYDVSACVVRGGAGLLVVDSRASHRQADELRADLREFGPLTVVALVNTHAFGNARFGPGSDLTVPIYAHRLVPAHLDAYERPMLAEWVARGEEPVDEWREVVITPPTVLVDEGASLDLGDRTVAMRHLGRGHTDNDLLVHVPDASAWLVGDVLEESGPPMYGSVVLQMRMLHRRLQRDRGIR